MAKAKTSSGSKKISCGARQRGTYQKSSGPKDKPTKKYNRQGR